LPLLFPLHFLQALSERLRKLLQVSIFCASYRGSLHTHTLSKLATFSVCLHRSHCWPRYFRFPHASAVCAVAAGVYVVLGGVDVHAAEVLVDGVDALVGEHAAAADALATATAAVGAAHWDC